MLAGSHSFPGHSPTQPYAPGFWAGRLNCSPIPRTEPQPGIHPFPPSQIPAGLLTTHSTGLAGQGEDLMQTTQHVHSFARVQCRGSIHVGHQRRTRPSRAIQPICFRDKESKGRDGDAISSSAEWMHKYIPAHKYINLRRCFVADTNYITNTCICGMYHICQKYVNVCILALKYINV